MLTFNVWIEEKRNGYRTLFIKGRLNEVRISWGERERKREKNNFSFSRRMSWGIDDPQPTNRIRLFWQKNMGKWDDFRVRNTGKVNVDVIRHRWKTVVSHVRSCVSYSSKCTDMEIDVPDRGDKSRKLQIRVFLSLYPIRLQPSIIYIPPPKKCVSSDPSVAFIFVTSLFFFFFCKSLRILSRIKIFSLISRTVAIILGYVWNFIFGNWNWKLIGWSL